MTDRLLVFRGCTQGSLDIYDQRGRKIGAAKREGGRLRKVGYRCRYRLNDAEPRGEVLDVSRGVIRAGSDFVINAPDGRELVRAYWREKRREDEHVVFDQEGVVVATLSRASREELRESRAPLPTSNPIRRVQQLHDRFVSGQLFYLLDHDNVRVARLTYVRTTYVFPQVALVLETQASVDERMRLIALAACVIADTSLIRQLFQGE
jgi:hypothetical protein